MNSESERRLSKLEQALKGNRQHMVVLACQDGDEERTVSDFRARISQDEQPELVVVLRRFTRDVGEPQVLHVVSVGGKPSS